MNRFGRQSSPAPTADTADDPYYVTDETDTSG